MRKDVCRRLFIGVMTFFAAASMTGGIHSSAFAQENYASEDSLDDESLVEETVDLSNTLQNGGLGTALENSDTATLASTYDKDAFETRLVEGFNNYESLIDVSDIGITRTEAYSGGINAVINAHPEIIGVAGTSYYYNSSTDLVTMIAVTYTSNAREEQQKLDAAIQKLDNEVDITGMTDEEIVLAYHEYLTATVAYAYSAYLNGTLGGAHEYDMYGTLVNHSCVCQGYAETMFYLLKRAGLPCAIASSKNINHAWNIVKIHGSWYHIDATWDDPVWDVPGRSMHTYFLVSFDTMNKKTLTSQSKDRTDMVVSAQWGDTYTSATDTTYESGKFWNGIEKVLYNRDGYWYSIGAGSASSTYQINKYKYSTNTNQVLYSGTAKWMASSSSYYSGQYGAIYISGNNLYFTTPDSLNKIDLSTSSVAATEVVNVRSKYNYAVGKNLYGLGQQYGKVVYIVADSPNFGYVKDSTDSTKYVKNFDEYELEVCTSHIWDSGKVIKEPTYKAEGTKKYTCKNCGETKTEVIEKLVCTEHVWDDGVVTVEPTYTENGIIKYTCTICGETNNKILDKLTEKECTEHVWDAGVVTVEPTYTATGIKTYTCANCGATKTEAVDMLKLGKVTVNAAVVSSGIKLTWSAEKNAAGYYIYRKSGNGQYALLKKITDSNTLTITDVQVTSGTIYTYKVQAYKGTAVGEESSAARRFVGTARINTANASNGVKLTWNKVGGASSYKIYRRTGTGSYSCIKTVSASVLTYLDTTAKAGTTYTYLVKPYSGTTAGTYTKSARVYLRSVTVKAGATKTGISVSWTKSVGATEYRVYRKAAGGKYALVKKLSGVNSLRWTDTNTAKGKTYYYYVRSFKGSYYSAASNVSGVKR